MHSYVNIYVCKHIRGWTGTETPSGKGITISMQSQSLTFGHPQGSLVGKYEPFGEQISSVVRK